MLHDKIPDGCKRRSDNHPAVDLPSADGTQLFLNRHRGIFHRNTENAGPGLRSAVDYMAEHRGTGLRSLDYTFSLTLMPWVLYIPSDSRNSGIAVAVMVKEMGERMKHVPMIQVDLFEVQLGASLLLQFHAPDGGTVRVLADGGQGLPVSDIHEKLIDAMESFGDGQRRIDLLVGTHYDADHLDGLIPIINDGSIVITEAWLPPVANDVEPHAVDEALDDHHFLPHQLYSPDGHRVLARYLDAKAQICQLLRSSDGERVPEASRIESADVDELPRLRDRFVQYRRDAVRELRSDAEGEAFTHADENAFDPASPRELLEDVDWFWSPYDGPWRYHDRFAQSDLTELSTGMLREVRPRSVPARNLAGIQKSAASDAINAISLARITNALRARPRPIPIRCHTINDGTPRRFVWRTGARRFEGGYHLSEHGPTFMLLGPSKGLVRKHWDRLPIGVYAEVALYSLGVLKSITPSIQLSYVMRFSAEDQGILVSGDAGCVDFKPKGRKPYYPDLLKALSPLHVVQVAHHGGNNDHFYRVLNAARYPKTGEQSYLLISHATHDRHRPSDEFRKFVEHVRHDAEIVSVLFTTQPLPEKVSDFASLVHTTVGPPAKEGDVRLEFRNGAWEVTKHAIAVPSEQQPGSTGQQTMALDHDLSIKPPIKTVKRRKKGNGADHLKGETGAPS